MYGILVVCHAFWHGILLANHLSLIRYLHLLNELKEQLSLTIKEQVQLDILFIVTLQVTKDATQGSEPGKTIALYVLDALICVDHERYFLSQLQSRGFLRSCLTNISNASFQVLYISTLTCSYSSCIHPKPYFPRYKMKGGNRDFFFF